MGLMFESIYRAVRAWWQSVVRWAFGDPERDEEPLTPAEELAEKHEGEVAAEKDHGVVRNPYRRRPGPQDGIHGWTEAGFEAWWGDLSDSRKRISAVEGFVLPVSLAGEDREYWQRRALRRAVSQK